MPNFAPSLIAALVWGAMFTITSTALDRIDAVHLTALRYAGAVAIFLALLAAIEGRRSLRFGGQAGKIFALGTLGFAGFNLLSFAALEYIRPEQAALVVATSPLITLFFRWVRDGERPLRIQLGAVVAALLGVALVITKGDPSAVVDGGFGIGHLMVLVGVIAWVRYTLGAAEFPEWSPLRFTALTAALGLISILGITLVADAGGWLSPPSAADLGAILPQLAYVIVFGAVVGVLAWNSGVVRLGPSNAALFLNLVPVTAFAIEAARGTEPTAVELAGATLTVAALVTANLAGRRATARAASAHRAAQEGDDGVEELAAVRGGGERVEVARVRAAVDER
jgi:drug/metabolite transporter (DMT)-like permease